MSNARASLLALSSAFLLSVTNAAAQTSFDEHGDAKTPVDEPVDEPAETSPSDPAVAETAPNQAPPSQPKIVSPRAIETGLEYPKGATGAARVVLELVIDAKGLVTDSKAISGDEPFASAAVEASRSWRFDPATADGKPMAARVRFEALFEPPRLESPEAPPAPSKAAETSMQVDPASTSAHEYETEIIVEGELIEHTYSMSRAEVRQLPGAMGDPFRAVEALPGVTPIISGLPYFYVRGAPPGNIGYFLDNVRIPVLYHIGAGPAVVHPAFIDTVDLYPGPYPARYGRYTGGIVAGQTADPQYETRGEASIRLVDAGAMLETHAFERRLSVMLAGRYSYTAGILSLFAPEIDLSYWDYQARGQYRLTGNETVTLFGFGSLDQASETRPNGEEITIFDLIFHRWNARYRRALDDGGFWELYGLGGIDITRLAERDGPRFEDKLLGGGFRMERPWTKRLAFRAGLDVESTTHRVRIPDKEPDGIDDPGAPIMDPSAPAPTPIEPPPDVSPEDIEERDDDDENFRDFFPSRTDVVTGAYFDLVWQPEPGVRVIPGTRVDLYFSSGHAFLGISPRISAALDVSDTITLHHGLGVAHQMPSFVVPLPGVQPAIGKGLQRAIQHSAGVEKHFDADIDATATVFQNIQLNLTDSLSAIHLENGADPTEDVRGIGGAKGLELMIKRPLDRELGGYLSYTLSFTNRSIGRYSGPSSFDRRHVLGAALGYELGKGWIAGLRGTFYTGIPGRITTSYEELAPGLARLTIRQARRTDPFWRLDWRLEKRWSIGQDGRWWALVFEAINTTLNKEMIERSCNEDRCRGEVIGPVTIPSIGVEASL